MSPSVTRRRFLQASAVGGFAAPIRFPVRAVMKRGLNPSVLVQTSSPWFDSLRTRRAKNVFQSWSSSCGPGCRFGVSWLESFWRH